MHIEILGSGGAISTPRPGCNCKLCTTARIHGIPFERTGPAVFIHDLHMLVDTPEESKYQLNRANIQRIEAGLYSHWHPDHTAGSRIWESWASDWQRFRQTGSRMSPQRCVPIYLPSNVAAEWPRFLGLDAKFKFLEHIGAIKTEIIGQNQPFQLGQASITPITLWEEYVSAFLIEHDDQIVFLAMDELHNWSPPKLVHNVDLAIMPMGIPQYHPITKHLLVSPEHPIFAIEASFEQTLEMVKTMQPKRVVFMHIEEAFGLSPSDLESIAYTLQVELGIQVTFAYDGMHIHI